MRISSAPGRPPTGIRKEVLQAPLDPDDADLLDKAAAELGRTKADLGRALIKGEMGWGDISKAAKKGKR